MNIDVKIRHAGGVTIFDLAGCLVAGAEGDTLRTILLQAYGKGDRWLLLNCEQLSSVDSCGIGDLVGAYSTIVRRGGVLRLLNPSQRLMDLLALTRLDSLFEIYDDELIALESFNSQANARTQQKLANYLDPDA